MSGQLLETVEPNLRDAGVLARRCDYAFEARGTEDNPINWGDAEAFFFEGWKHGAQSRKVVLRQAFMFLMNNVTETKNEIGGVIGYRLNLNEEQTRELWNLLA